MNLGIKWLRTPLMMNQILVGYTYMTSRVLSPNSITHHLVEFGELLLFIQTFSWDPLFLLKFHSIVDMSKLLV
jgi:hypothetical protein